MVRRALDSLQDTLWGDILRKNKFTALGAAHFLRDLHAVFAMVERYVPDCSTSTMGTIADAAKLLNLPVEAGEGDGEGHGEGDVMALSLGRASDRVFTDNQEARKVLEELGIETLEPGNARMILQRRVENSD